MGSVTIINNTNTTINSCISAGVNYSWVNKLSPKQFYSHNGAAGVYTLNVKYWFGEPSEFANSAAEIGVWVTGVVLAVVGVLAIPLTSGASSGLVIAAVGLVSGAGLAVSGISIAVADFRNEPSTWTNIHALQNRRFVAEAQVESKYDEKDKVVTFTKVPNIVLREIDEKEFQKMIREEGLVGYQQNPADAAPLPDPSSDATPKALLSKRLRIFPSMGGDACWEVESDQRSDDAPMQLWARDVPLVRWCIVPVSGTAFAGDVFALHNPELDRYATHLDGPGNRVTSSAKRRDHDRQLFRIVQSGEHWAFFPAHDVTKAVIPEDGGRGNSTKLVVAPRVNAQPSSGRWKLVEG